MTPVRSTPPRRTRPATAAIRHKDDSHAWALQQVGLLRDGRLEEIDAATIVGDLGEIIIDASVAGRYAALRDTPLPKRAMPTSNPYTSGGIMDRDISWPDE